jgi:hypothetical protein
MHNIKVLVSGVAKSTWVAASHLANHHQTADSSTASNLVAVGSNRRPPTLAAMAATIGDGVTPIGGSTSNPLAASGCWIAGYVKKAGPRLELAV